MLTLEARCMPCSLAAGRLVDEMQGSVEASTTPSTLAASQLARLHQLLHEARFQPPDGTHLSPAGTPLATLQQQGLVCPSWPEKLVMM